MPRTRGSRGGNIASVQVTFSKVSLYTPNMQREGLIPTDSVRADMSTDSDNSDTSGGLEHVCASFAAGNTPSARIGLSGFQGAVQDFDASLVQGREPTMCRSPQRILDDFVAYSILLGFEVFDGHADETRCSMGMQTRLSRATSS